MKNYKNILLICLVAFLAGVTIFSLYRYLSALKEQYDLKNSLSQMRDQLQSLDMERQNLLQAIEKEKEAREVLSQENLDLKDNLQVTEDRLLRQAQDFSEVQKKIEDLTLQTGILKAENDALRQEKDTLSLQMAQIAEEKEALKTRLSSISELKKAIRDLKRQIRSAKVEVKKKTVATRIIEGNRGFLFKNGKPTNIPKVKIEVRPLSSGE